MKLKLLIIALLFGITVKAQNTPNVTPSHLKAADELLKISGADSLFKSSMQLSLKQSSANIPADKREKFMEVMNSFFAKYISWDLLKDQLAAIYASEFTEPELKQITAFYRTPLGKKLNAKQPVIMQRSMVLGQQMVQSHQVELQQMLQDAFKEQQ